MMLEHANITVSDLERSISFYEEALGFEVRWRGEVFNTSRKAAAAHVGPSGEAFYLSLFEAVNGGRAKYDYAPPGINHLGIVVDDLDDARRQLEAAGAMVAMGSDYDPGRRLYFFDPDGIEIELVQY